MHSSQFHETSHSPSVSHSTHLVLCDKHHIASPTHSIVPLYTSFSPFILTDPSLDDPELHSYSSTKPSLTIIPHSFANQLRFASDPHEYDVIEATSHSHFIHT